MIHSNLFYELCTQIYDMKYKVFHMSFDRKNFYLLTQLDSHKDNDL